MSLPATSRRMNRPIVLIAASTVAVAFALWDVPRASAALIGAALSVANWFALRWLVVRLASQPQSPLLSGILLVAKIGVLIGAVFVLISRLGVDPIGLAFGLSVLFVGPVLAALRTLGPTASLDPSAARPAREER